MTRMRDLTEITISIEGAAENKKYDASGNGGADSCMSTKELRRLTPEFFVFLS